MATAHDRTQRRRSIAWRSAGLVCGIFLLIILLVEPALANKFETISGGVTGSSAAKRAWLQIFFSTVGTLSLLGSILSIFVPHSNALLMNFNNWKQSAVILAVLSILSFAAAVAI